MDDPVPVRRAAIGCLTIAVLVGGLMLLVRPTIFTFAPARDDTAVVVAAATEVGARPSRREVILTRSYGWAGELDAGDGRVQLALYIGRSALGGITAVNASSPAEPNCPVEVFGDRLTDCGGRSWTFEGLPIESGFPALERFPVEMDGASVAVDLTRLLD